MRLNVVTRIMIADICFICSTLLRVRTIIKGTQWIFAQTIFFFMRYATRIQVTWTTTFVSSIKAGNNLGRSTYWRHSFMGIQAQPHGSFLVVNGTNMYTCIKISLSGKIWSLLIVQYSNVSTILLWESEAVHVNCTSNWF